MKKFLILVLLLIIIPNISKADIAFDNFTNGGFFASGTTDTYSHTVSGSDKILFVFIRLGGTSDLVTSVTYNGDGMTLVDKDIGSNNLGTYLYYLVNPDSGTHDVTINLSSTATVLSTASSYNGANQTTQLDATGKTSGTGTIGTISLTTVADNTWIVAGFNSGAGNLDSLSDIYTRGFGDNTGIAFFDSNGNISPASAQSPTVIMDSGLYRGIYASINPSTTGSGTTTATTTTEILYSDWLLVNSVIIFMLSFLTWGYLWSIFKVKK